MILLGIVLVLIVINILLPRSKGPELKIVLCRPHKWKYDEAGLLICDNCNKRPNDEDL